MFPLEQRALIQQAGPFDAFVHAAKRYRSDVTFLPIAGDDPAAKQAVTAFLDSIGYGTVDAGSLADSWRQEPGTPVYGAPYGSFSQEAGTPASEDTIRVALAAATR